MPLRGQAGKPDLLLRCNYLPPVWQLKPTGCGPFDRVEVSKGAHDSRRHRCRAAERTRKKGGKRTRPAKLLPKSIYGTSLWVHLLLEKFHLQRPMHRTLEQLRLLGLSLAPGTVNDGLRRIEPLFVPLYESIRDRHLQSAYFQADETRWKVFVEKAGKTGHLWWLWLFAGEDGSGSEWAGRLAMMLFSIFATLDRWKINPRKWLHAYFDACAANGGQVPDNPASFLPWNLSEDRLADLRRSPSDTPPLDTS